MIVGLHGKMNAGKNEAARRLALLSPLPVVEVSFAAKLKQSAAAVLGCDVSELEMWKNLDGLRVVVRDIEEGETVTGQSVRSFLQRYGTEAHRDIFGANFWLDAALPIPNDPVYDIHPSAAYDDALYVVTDVRFPNEAQRVTDLGGIVVGIFGAQSDTGSHVSETPLDCEHWIDNTVRDDNFATLDKQLRDLLDVALGGSRRAA